MLVVIDKHSNSNGSITLHTLRSVNFCYISGLPMILLPSLTQALTSHRVSTTIDVSIHGVPRSPRVFRRTVDGLPSTFSPRLLFLSTSHGALVHHCDSAHQLRPLSDGGLSLRDTVSGRDSLLRPLHSQTSLVISASRVSIRRLTRVLHAHLLNGHRHRLAVIFRSFNFGRNVPVSTSCIFSIHFLPGPR